MKTEFVRTKYEGVYLRSSSYRRNPLDGKKDGCFYYSIKEGTKKKWVRVGWKSEGFTAQVAMTKRADHMHCLRSGKTYGSAFTPELTEEDPIMTFGEAWALYENKWLPTFANPRAEIGRYRIHIEPRFSKISLDKITPLDLESFKQDLLAKKLSPKSVKHILCLMHSVYNKMVRWELYEGRIPTSKLELPKVDNARVRYLTPSEIHLIFERLKGIHLTWWRMASVSLHAGLRLGEVVGLIWGDLDMEAGVIHIRDAKCGTRMAYMNETLKTIFSDMENLPNTQKSGKIFSSSWSGVGCPPNVTKVFHRVVESLGLNRNVPDPRQKVVFHTLRHTFASWLAIGGVPLYTIATLIGHSTLNMTKRYAHLCPDSHREAISKLDQIATMKSLDTVSAPPSSPDI